MKLTKYVSPTNLWVFLNEITAKWLKYDNSASDLISTTAQEALDELSVKNKALEKALDELKLSAEQGTGDRFFYTPNIESNSTFTRELKEFTNYMLVYSGYADMGGGPAPYGTECNIIVTGYEAGAGKVIKHYSDMSNGWIPEVAVNSNVLTIKTQNLPISFVSLVEL